MERELQLPRCTVCSGGVFVVGASMALRGAKCWPHAGESFEHWLGRYVAHIEVRRLYGWRIEEVSRYERQRSRTDHRHSVAAARRAAMAVGSFPRVASVFDLGGIGGVAPDGD